jgi:hypothetical protein
VSPTRADLLALNTEALGALSNRGLVKRAVRDVEAGSGPAVSVEADATVVGVHPDGAHVTLPPGAALGSCTCGAPGICRHVLATVLAYQAGTAATAAPTATAPAESTVDSWSPGEFTDAALEALVGSRALTAARRAYRAGYQARVRRPTSQRPEPIVELASCTVRFLVPHELGYAHADAATGARPDAIPLAVWAFRAADERQPDGVDVELDVGGPASTVDDGAAGTGVESAVALAAEVLTEGIVHIGASFATVVARVRRDLDRRGLRWPLLAVEDLAEQLDEYRDRGARYHAEQAAAVLAEIVARHRAAAGGVLRTRVLGTEEPAETPLRRVRFTGLGARVTGTENDRTVEVFLAHPDNGVVLVLRRRWPETVTGAELGLRRLGGATIAALAAGHVVTESAYRGASRTLRLATGRVARTTVTPAGGAYDDLPDTLLVRDVAATAEQLAQLPPRLVRPRVEAEFVRAVAVAEVVSVGYRPGAQRLDAVVADASGATALVRLRHEAAAPAALEALADALAAGPRFLTGFLRRSRGGLVIEPLAVVVGDTVTVPALASGDGSTSLELAGEAEVDALTAALDPAIALLAEVAHRGLRHLPVGFPDRLRAAGNALARVGLHPCAEAVRGLAAAVERDRTVGPGPAGDAAVAAWVDAQIRLSVAADLR